MRPEALAIIAALPGMGAFFLTNTLKDLWKDNPIKSILPGHALRPGHAAGGGFKTSEGYAASRDYEERRDWAAKRGYLASRDPAADQLEQAGKKSPALRNYNARQIEAAEAARRAHQARTGYAAGPGSAVGSRYAAGSRYTSGAGQAAGAGFADGSGRDENQRASSVDRAANGPGSPVFSKMPASGVKTSSGSPSKNTCVRTGWYRSNGAFLAEEKKTREWKAGRKPTEFSSIVKEECEWRGTTPLCGSTTHWIGDVVDGWTLVGYDNNEYISLKDICNNPFNSFYSGQECCKSYGWKCASGYKRLWCRTKKPF